MSIRELVSDYEYDDVAQLLLLVEQLEVSEELLNSGSVAQMRSALILLDSQAEILLNRWWEGVFAAGDRRGPSARRAYVKKDQQRLLRNFDLKTEAAAGIGELASDFRPILDADTAACLKLAHRHRNGAYHADRHNEDLLFLLGLLQVRGVCRLLAETTPSVILSFSSQPLPEIFRRYGVEASDTDGLRSGVDLSAAAGKIASRIVEDIHAPLLAVKFALVNDLADRAGSAVDVVQELQREGLDIGRIYFAIAHDEFWKKVGADRALVELRLRSDTWRRRGEVEAGELTEEELRRDAERANTRRNERYVELQRDFVPEARPEAVFEAIERAEELLEMETLAEVVGAYDQLERALSAFERHLPAAVRALDALVERQIDHYLESKAAA